MEKVTEILARKQVNFNTISPDCSLTEALGRMCTQKFDYLIVLENNNFLGLLTEHDITRKSFFLNQDISKFTVKQLMNTRFPVADINNTLDECMVLMKRHRVRYLPVFDNTAFLGILTSDDVINEAVLNREGIFDRVERVIL